MRCEASRGLDECIGVWLCEVAGLVWWLGGLLASCPAFETFRGAGAMPIGVEEGGATEEASLFEKVAPDAEAEVLDCGEDLEDDATGIEIGVAVIFFDSAGARALVAPKGGGETCDSLNGVFGRDVSPAFLPCESGAEPFFPLASTARPLPWFVMDARLCALSV